MPWLFLNLSFQVGQPPQFSLDKRLSMFEKVDVEVCRGCYSQEQMTGNTESVNPSWPRERVVIVVLKMDKNNWLIQLQKSLSRAVVRQWEWGAKKELARRVYL